MSNPSVSAVTAGGTPGPTSTASTGTRRDDATEVRRPVRIGSTVKMDAKARKKMKELESIASVGDAMTHLVRKGYATEDTTWDPRLVISTIIQLTASVPTEEAVILKSLAVILERVDFEMHGQLLTTALIQELEDPLGDLRDMREVVKRAEATVEDIEEEVSRIRTATEDIRAELDESRDSDNETLKQIQQAVERLEETVKTTARQAETAAEERGNRQTQPRTRSPTPTDYDRCFPPIPDIPLSQRIGPPMQLPPSHEATIARAEQKARQILFRPLPNMPPHKLNELSHEAIVKKANVALEALATKRNDIPKGMAFLGVNLLSRGDIVFDLSSKEAADWLKRDEVKTSYMEGFGALTEIVDREHAVVVENIPVTFEPGTESFRRVETANGLDQGAILLGRWFKKKEDRSPNQKTAFMKVFFKSAETANKVIRNRILIGGRRCNARKLLPEPRRCFKCQKIGTGHMAQHCPLDHSICANCAKHHPTQRCPVTEEIDKHSCANCAKEGHGAGNRECPIYTQKRDELQGRNSELLYKFFPTADSTTWELLNPTASTLAAYAPPVDQYRATNERQLGWIEERRQWLASNRNPGDPSQRKRAQANKDQSAKLAIAASRINAPSGLHQATLNFAGAPNPAPERPRDNPSPTTATNPTRPSSAPTNPPIERSATDSRSGTDQTRPTTSVDFTSGEIRTSRQMMPNGQLSDISFLDE